MKKRTLLIGFGGNLLIALFGLLQAFHGFSRVFGVLLYFGKRGTPPDGTESWLMPALIDCRDTFLRLIVALLVLAVFNSIFWVWIWSSKKNDDSVV
jgi:hypothetical protein